MNKTRKQKNKKTVNNTKEPNQNKAKQPVADFRNQNKTEEARSGEPP